MRLRLLYAQTLAVNRELRAGTARQLHKKFLATIVKLVSLIKHALGIRRRGSKQIPRSPRRERELRLASSHLARSIVAFAVAATTVHARMYVS